MKNLKEIRILWDWQVAVIPKEYVKKLQYTQSERNAYEVECNEVVLVIDLEYIKKHKLNNEEITIFDRIQNKDIWNIELITEDEKILLNLPSYRKEIYCGEKELLVSEDAENLCELHQTKNNEHIMEWRKTEEKDFYMNQKEWSIFFQKGIITEISNITHQLGLELVDRILFRKKDENLDVIQRMHKVEARTGTIYSVKKGYIISKEYYPLHELDICILNAKNHSYHWNFNFVLVPNLEREEQNLYKVIEEGIPNEDTRNYFSRTIVVYDEKDKLQEDMLEYLNEDLLFITYQELNKIWYNIHKEWELL